MTDGNRGRTRREAGAVLHGSPVVTFLALTFAFSAVFYALIIASGHVAAVGIAAVPPWGAALLMVLLESVFGFARSCANALGEEIGWRGFLVPLLAGKGGFAAASVVTGCVWAAWHYPVLLLADCNLGAPGWYALPCFTVMILGLSVISTWFRLRTGSLWTATFLHASHNVLIQAVFTPLTGDTGPTRYAIDEFGFVLALVVCATAVWFWRNRRVAVEAWREEGLRSGTLPEALSS